MTTMKVGIKIFGNKPLHSIDDIKIVYTYGDCIKWVQMYYNIFTFVICEDAEYYVTGDRELVIKHKNYV